MVVIIRVSLNDRYPALRYPALGKNHFTGIIDYWPLCKLAAASIDAATFFDTIVHNGFIDCLMLFRSPAYRFSEASSHQENENSRHDQQHRRYEHDCGINQRGTDDACEYI